MERRNVAEAYWQDARFKKKRVGHQYVGQCPLCGGDDRFHVTHTATASVGKDVWWCRQCPAPWDALFKALGLWRDKRSAHASAQQRRQPPSPPPEPQSAPAQGWGEAARDAFQDAKNRVRSASPPLESPSDSLPPREPVNPAVLTGAELAEIFRRSHLYLAMIVNAGFEVWYCGHCPSCWKQGDPGLKESSFDIHAKLGDFECTACSCTDEDVLSALSVLPPIQIGDAP